MADNKHQRGLQKELDEQIKSNRKQGGPSDAFKKEAAKHGISSRPGGSWKKERRDGFVRLDGRGLVMCIRCGKKKLNGYLEEELCEDCHED